MSMRSYVPIGLAFLVCYGAGFIGSFFVDAGAGSWYASLEKPFFTPPASVFAPVWLVLYGLMATALSIVWIKDPNAEDMTGWVPIFFIHLVANMAWTIFFFGFHTVFIALIDIFILVCMVLLLLCAAWRIDRRASYLLLPYLTWVLFALLLNITIWVMN